MSEDPRNGPTTPASASNSRTYHETEPPASELLGQESTSRIEAMVPLALIVMDRWPMGPVSFRYAKAMEAGVKFPAIKLARRTDGRFQIRDGRHRLLAAKLLGHSEILARYSTSRMRMTAQ